MHNLAIGLGLASRALTRRTLFFLTPLLLLLLAACSSGSVGPRISGAPEAGGPQSSGILITTDTACGANR